MDDPKFDGIRDDPRVFGSWVLLLLVADMAHPASAFIPPMVPRAAFRTLVASGLVDDLGAHRFRLHGLASERAKRSDSARNAAASRWQSGRSADGMPRRDETRKDETRQEKKSRDDARASSDAAEPSLLAAFRRQGLPVDTA
jgi:hypothetical protein